MKALQIRGPRDVAIIEVPKPSIRSDDQVLIRVRASSICNQHEWKIFNDLYHGGLKCSYPGRSGYPGHEASGEVVDIGDRVTNLAIGDHVVMNGHCGDLHQEVVVCPESLTLRTTSSATFVHTAPTELFACSRALLARGEYITGAHCVVIGLGPAGLAAIQWLRVLGARKITGMDKVEERLEKGMEMGADEGICAADKEALHRLTETQPETVMDCSGTHEGFRMAFRMASKEALLFGYNDQPFEVVEAEWFAKSLTIRTQFAFDSEIWARTITMLNRGLIDPGKLVSHKVPFTASAYAEAMSMIGKPDVYKIVMEYDEQEA